MISNSLHAGTEGDSQSVLFFRWRIPNDLRSSQVIHTIGGEEEVEGNSDADISCVEVMSKESNGQQDK